MKRRFFRALVIALALMLCAAALAEVRTTAQVNMRSGPGLNYSVITSFKAGRSLTYLGETSVDNRGVAWYKVSDGSRTGWVSSRYSQLRGENSQPAPQPTARPTAKPTPTPPPVSNSPISLNPNGGGSSGANPNVGQNADNIWIAFDDNQANQAPAQTQTQTVELSGYYMTGLQAAAAAIGLTDRREVQSEAPVQYYNNSVIIAGNQNVSMMVVYGGGYSIYGVTVNMSRNAAMACLNAAGLDMSTADDGMLVYEHRGTGSAGFVNETGHDSCINLWVQDGVITEIDWSTYTG